MVCCSLAFWLKVLAESDWRQTNSRIIQKITTMPIDISNFCILELPVFRHGKQWPRIIYFIACTCSWSYYLRSHGCCRMTYCCTLYYSIINQIYICLHKNYILLKTEGQRLQHLTIKPKLLLSKCMLYIPENSISSAFKQAPY